MAADSTITTIMPLKSLRDVDPRNLETEYTRYPMRNVVVRVAPSATKTKAHEMLLINTAFDWLDNSPDRVSKTIVNTERANTFELVSQQAYLKGTLRLTDSIRRQTTLMVEQST